MEKTKLGISVGLLGAAMYFSCFCGYLAVIILAGYILLFEEDLWLKQTAVKATVILFTFEIAIALTGLITNTMNMVDSIYELVNKSFYSHIITHIELCLQQSITILRKLLLIILGFKALKHGTIAIEKIDGFVAKHM